MKRWFLQQSNDTHGLHVWMPSFCLCVRNCVFYLCVICCALSILFSSIHFNSPLCSVLISHHSLFRSPAVALDLLVLHFASRRDQQWPVDPTFYHTFYGIHISFGIWAAHRRKVKTFQFPCQQIQSADNPIFPQIKPARQCERGSWSEWLIGFHLVKTHLEVCIVAAFR